ncbi:coiled-coil domain containing 65 [Perkinsus chesapeaki]|uniref:Dynein regulatory complex subunit 2 n=1 Tax=Perkinsus chesapeaki TaxID=330153 RepID=A0A7J6N117_PERCH|nr:coiled-coil domain containing 65 [Perkinsus chesapeaki]
MNPDLGTKAAKASNLKRRELKASAAREDQNSKHNANKILESWLKIMRAYKAQQLKRDVEIISQNHERDVDRKDAVLQMLDRDLDEAEEQHQVAIRSVFSDMDTLVEIFQRKLRAQNDKFNRQLLLMKEEFDTERRRLVDQHGQEVAELNSVIEQIDAIEKAREQNDLAEHQSNYEMIRNRDIEEDHQMRSHLEEQIEILKDRCNAQLASYKQATDANTADYKNYLERDRKGTL